MASTMSCCGLDFPDDVHSTLSVEILQSVVDISAVYALYGSVVQLLCIQFPLAMSSKPSSIFYQAVNASSVSND